MTQLLANDPNTLSDSQKITQINFPAKKAKVSMICFILGWVEFQDFLKSADACGLKLKIGLS
jgi:hypothetical protein